LFDEQHVELGATFATSCGTPAGSGRMHAGSEGATAEVQGEIDRMLLTGMTSGFLLKLNIAIQELTTSLAEYKFSEAAQTLYRFFWSDIAIGTWKRPGDADAGRYSGRRAAIPSDNASRERGTAREHAGSDWILC